MSLLQAIILSIIEGITEFLPISSTGHMIVASSIMGIEKNEFVKLFTVCIQLGAILSVGVLYFKRFFKTFGFYYKLLVAFFPAVVLGVLLNDFIDSLLENPLSVGIALLTGGIILLFVDTWFKNAHNEDSDSVSYPVALKIGLSQCLAMIPGVSRSAASIVGGMSQGLSRKAAAEFSFFLAIPTMLGATAKKLLDFLLHHSLPISNQEIQLLLLGNVIAFLVALFAIKSFIGFLSKNGFRIFGWYRIALGGIIITLYFAGIGLNIL